MPTCNHCGAFVTSRFACVFGDSEDDVYGCRSCMSTGELVEGDASRNDP